MIVPEGAGQYVREMNVRLMCHLSLKDRNVVNAVWWSLRRFTLFRVYCLGVFKTLLFSGPSLILGPNKIYKYAVNVCLNMCIELSPSN